MGPSKVPTVRLSRVEGEFAVARLGPGAPTPSALLAAHASIVSVTRTASELSIVCRFSDAPEGAEVDGPWSAWYVLGPIPFGLTGVVRAIVSPLSERGIPVFVISTFDSDLIMAPTPREGDAEAALLDAGHEIA